MSYSAQKQFGPKPLGKLCEKVRITLIPGRGCPSFTEIDWESYRELEYAATNTEAIRYPYGYPSGDQTYLKVKLGADLTLRRFACLATIKMQTNCHSWIYTGDVVVIDTNHKGDLRPWCVLSLGGPSE